LIAVTVRSSQNLQLSKFVKGCTQSQYVSA
jgi:hypothetical protein